jgi:hypothetical protein
MGVDVVVDLRDWAAIWKFLEVLLCCCFSSNDTAEPDAASCASLYCCLQAAGQELHMPLFRLMPSGLPKCCLDVLPIYRAACRIMMLILLCWLCRCCTCRSSGCCPGVSPICCTDAHPAVGNTVMLTLLIAQVLHTPLFWLLP